MLARRPLFALVVCLGLVVAGCGGGSSDASPEAVAAVKRTVVRALHDLARADGRGFCALETRSGRRAVAASATGYSCARLIRVLGARLSAANRDALLHSRVVRVKVSGRRASVTDADITTTDGSLGSFLDDGGRPTTLAEQADGAWKITG